MTLLFAPLDTPFRRGVAVVARDVHVAAREHNVVVVVVVLVDVHVVFVVFDLDMVRDMGFRCLAIQGACCS